MHYLILKSIKSGAQLVSIVITGFFLVLATTSNTQAQTSADGTFDPGFKSPYQNAFEVGLQHLALQKDGKILWVNFTTTEEVICSGSDCHVEYETHFNLFRTNPDGSPDTSFSFPAKNDPVNSLLVQDDGKILWAYGYSSFRGYIERLNSDGSVDTAFTANTSRLNTTSVNKLALLADGNILVAANLSGYNGIFRLHPDGSLDTSFKSASDVVNNITNIVVQNDGKILIVGWSTINGVKTWTINRLHPDGSRDNSFNSSLIVQQINGYAVIDKLALQSDGKIVVSGVTEPSRLYLVRLQPDGSQDTSFMPLLDSTSQTDWIDALLVQNDDKILIGGVFTFTNTTHPHTIARLNSSGSLDTSFSFTNADATNKDYISTMALQEDNKIVIAGKFKTNRGYYIARLNNTGKLKSTVGIASSSNPAVAGHAVTFTAQIAPQTATGTVTFNFSYADGTSTTTSPIMLVNGVASYTNSTPLSPSTNSYTVTVNYSGDASHLPGNSPAYTQYIVAGCDPLVVTKDSDNGAATTCGTLSYALAQTISGKISFELTTPTNIVSLNTTSGSLALKPGVALDGGPTGIILDGKGTSGAGLRLSGNNKLTNLTIRGFGGHGMIVSGKTNQLYKVIIVQN